jgi:3-hydroxybutyryl-CoA dehydratase
VVGSISGFQLEDLSPGQSAEHSWTVTEETINAFAEVSGDRNPLHLDAAYAASSPFKARIAHGMLAASYISAVLGMQLPGPGAIYLDQSLRFLRPVRIGDEVRVTVTVKTIDAAKAHVILATVCAVGRKTVVDGEAVVMVSRRSV